MPSSTKLTHSLVDVAMGRLPADVVIRNGQWVSVQSGEIIPGSDIAIKDGHIAYVGEDASHTIGKKTQVIQAKGRYLVPGLLDGHMHVARKGGGLHGQHRKDAGHQVEGDPAQKGQKDGQRKAQAGAGVSARCGR